ncbi:MAG: phosphoenolpyruvate synthase [Acidimicrobiales bacterium]
MGHDVLDLHEIDRAQVELAGGKAAQLGELTRIEGITVPRGVCVTTEVYRSTVLGTPTIAARLEDLTRLDPADSPAIGEHSAEVRQLIDSTDMPPAVTRAIASALAQMGEHEAYAVRSSATAEDSATASFAGQHDTYLDIVGLDEILLNIRRCWGSLFTERAVTYRQRSGIDHRSAAMAVIVQRMVHPRAAGVLFTADPVTSNRRVSCVEAVRGLAEDLVSGAVTPDRYTVRDDRIVSRETTSPDPVLADSDVEILVGLGRRIEASVGSPQDIEWCIADDGAHIVQSRPITTLFPVPESEDGAPHLYVSVGHQQMMTDAMTPLGVSVWQRTAMIAMHEAGGRLFVDVAGALSSQETRGVILDALGASDPLIGDALETVLERGDILPVLPEPTATEGPGPRPQGVAPPTIEADSALVADVIERNQASVARLESSIRGMTGTELIDVIAADIDDLRQTLLDPGSHAVIMAAMEASEWLNDRLGEWLGEINPADTLSLSVPGNVTAQMGLELLDLADIVRRHPQVVEEIGHLDDEWFFDELGEMDGGTEVRQAIEDYLEAYGMRCVGEIDIGRPRWSERPSTLVPLILSNVENFEPGAGSRLFDRGRHDAAAKQVDLVERLADLLDGAAKAAETERMIDRLRTFTGYREYPKYGIVRRYAIYKQALLAEAERLRGAGVIDEADDIVYLRLDELREAVRTQRVDRDLLGRRKEQFRSFQALNPPRVMTSEGEVVTGSYRRDDLPSGALAGLPVSVGTVVGRARVVHDVADAALAPGDILVTRYTDPSWTPAFVAIAGLVTEVGGQMTHGAVIAREYGLPAVVGVERATELIEDGQMIRVNGSAGYVEVLGDDRSGPT